MCTDVVTNRFIAVQRLRLIYLHREEGTILVVASLRYFSAGMIGSGCAEVCTREFHPGF